MFPKAGEGTKLLEISDYSEDALSDSITPKQLQYDKSKKISVLNKYKESVEYKVVEIRVPDKDKNETKVSDEESPSDFHEEEVLDDSEYKTDVKTEFSEEVFIEANIEKNNPAAKSSELKYKTVRKKIVIGYKLDEKEFPYDPPFCFNWLYIKALYNHPEWAEEVANYDVFTCQTRIDNNANPAVACAIYRTLKEKKLLEQAMRGPYEFMRTVYCDEEGILYTNTNYRGYKELSREEEIKLINLAKEGEKDAQEEVLKRYEYLIRTVIKKKFAYIIRKISKSGETVTEYERLLYGGMIEIMNAWKNYNPERNISFSTYAYRCIECNLHRQLHDETNSEVQKVKREIAKWKESHDGEPTPDDILKAIKEKNKDKNKKSEPNKAFIRNCMVIENTISLNYDDNEERNDFIQDENLESSVIDRLVKDDISKYIELLQKDERKVICWLYGCCKEEKLKITEIARRLKISPDKVRDLEASAKGKLKTYLTKEYS